MDMEKNKNAMGIAALVLGIISIVLSIFWYMSIPTGIMGIIFGIKSSKKSGSKLGKAGLITGIVGVSLCVFIYMSMISLIILNNM